MEQVLVNGRSQKKWQPQKYHKKTALAKMVLIIMVVGIERLTSSVKEFKTKIIKLNYRSKSTFYKREFITYSFSTTLWSTYYQR